MVHGPKQCHPSQSKHSVVVSTFRQRKELGPVDLLVVAKGWEISFHGLVLPLGLAVSLPLEGSRESVVIDHVEVDSCPELAGELRSVVGDNV